MHNRPQQIIALTSPDGSEHSRRDEAAQAALGSEASKQFAGLEIDYCLGDDAAGLTESEHLTAPVAEAPESLTVATPSPSTVSGLATFIPPRIQASITATPSTTILASAPAIRRTFLIRTYDELQQRCSELGAADYLVEGMIPARSIVLVVGDSGLGKSPLLYQLGICVAAGVPFLGCPVRQGPTLYLDYENGLAESSEIVRRISTHLRLESPPTEFNIWNFNDSSPLFGTEGHNVMDMIKFLRPALVIIDSLSAYRPEIEDKPSSVTQAFQELRKLIRDLGVTILAVHHIRKPSTKPGEAPSPLDEGDVKKWFLQTRGTRNLINASDVRLGIDVPSVVGGLRDVQQNDGDQIALVLAGFGRVRGEIGPLFIARAFDEDGEPLGYRRMIGVELLFNEDQQQAFSRLPQTFRTGEAKRIYGRQDQATGDYLKKCQRLGLVKKISRGQYEKCGTTE